MSNGNINVEMEVLNELDNFTMIIIIREIIIDEEQIIITNNEVEEDHVCLFQFIDLFIRIDWLI